MTFDLHKYYVPGFNADHPRFYFGVYPFPFSSTRFRFSSTRFRFSVPVFIYEYLFPFLSTRFRFCKFERLRSEAIFGPQYGP